MTKTILDMACGSRMFYFDKQNPNVEFCDIREYYEELPTGHIVNVAPTTKADFRSLPFDDQSFHLVIFDPPHLIHAGDSSWLAKKYGKLNPDTYREDIAKGFEEGFRVLKPGGTLVFKWNEDQIKTSEILMCTPHQPIMLQKRSKTQFIVFWKAL